MSPQQPWFERTFEFSFPVEHFSNVCARLRGTPARMEEILTDVSGNVLVRKPEAKWSAQEHAGHLLDLEPLWTARVNDFVAGATVLTAAELRNKKTDEANHNSQKVEEILSSFRAARTILLERAETVDPGLYSHTIPHPRLQKPMRLVDHLYFVAEHDDHHLARIWELIRRSDYRM